MYRHLVTIKVSIEGGANQRVQLNGLALDQHGLESLDTQPMQGRCAVEHHRMLANHILENVPNHRGFRFNFFLGCLDGCRNTLNFQLVEDEGLEQLQRHLLWQTALVQFQLRANDDHRATGVIHALAKQVLTETSALPLDHIGQRFQRTLVGTSHSLATATVIQQGVHRFLQHALFVAHDNFRRLEFKQPLEAVVTVDNAAIQVVQIGGGESPTVQWNQRTQFRRQYRQHFQNHPVRLDTRFLETLQNLQALGKFLDLGLGRGLFQFLAQGFHFAVQFELTQQIANALRAHQGLKVITKLFRLGQIVVFGQQLARLERRHPSISHDIGFEIQHPLDIAQGHVQHQA